MLPPYITCNLVRVRTDRYRYLMFWVFLGALLIQISITPAAIIVPLLWHKPPGTGNVKGNEFMLRSSICVTF